MKDIIRMNQLAGTITEGQANKMMIALNENNISEISDEMYERMEGLVNQNDLDTFISAATNIMGDLSDEGFEAKDVFDYLYTKLTTNV